MKYPVFDIYNADNGEFFKKARTVFLYGQINGEMAYTVGNCLKYLDYIDSESPITLEINSPGGEVSSGLAIIDTIRYSKAPVRAVVCGMAASMAALIAACCTKGMRSALPHSTIMIHQPLGGAQGQASDVLIEAKHMQRLKDRLNKIMAKNTGHTVEEVERDTDRNNWMFAEEAMEYGLIDHIIEDEQ